LSRGGYVAARRWWRGSRGVPQRLRSPCRALCLRTAGLLDWDSLRDVVGFNAYYAEEERYRG